MVYSNFNSILEFDSESCRESNFIVVTDVNIDGNFLIHHFISHFTKSNGSISILGMAQTQTHYSSATHKLGVNLQQLLKDGRLKFIDGLQYVCDAFTDKTNERSPLKDLTVMVDEAITSTSTHQNGHLFVIDDLTALLNIGCSTQNVFDFIHHCKVMSEKHNISFLLLSHADMEDDEYAMLSSRLQQYASLHVNAQALRTGYSKDLSGEMQVYNFKNPYATSKKVLHFKLMDRDMRTFAPGTSSAVL